MILHNTVRIPSGVKVDFDTGNKVKGKVHPRTGHEDPYGE
jgi:hypothetical protein